MPRGRKYPRQLIDRGVRLAIESGRPIRHVADGLKIDHETLRNHARQAKADGGLRPDLPTSEEREEIKQLRKEVHARSPYRAGLTAVPAAEAHRQHDHPARLLELLGNLVAGRRPAPPSSVQEGQLGLETELLQA